MRKIPTLFVRDPDNLRRVINQTHPDCQWVTDGEGRPTRKYDGTCVMLDDYGRWWARREIKPGKPAPVGFTEVNYDDTTGKTVGWEPIDQSPFIKAWQEAIQNTETGRPIPGTYELCGPKINNNPEKLPQHTLVRHGQFVLDAPRDYASLKTWLLSHDYEGIVWHRDPDNLNTEMAKIKRRDFS